MSKQPSQQPRDGLKRLRGTKLRKMTTILEHGTYLEGISNKINKTRKGQGSENLGQ